MKVSTVLGMLTGCIALSACMYSPRGPSPQQVRSVWVCHGDQSRQWQRVSAADGDGYRSRGDRVTSSPQNEGQRCDNTSDSRDRRGN